MSRAGARSRVFKGPGETAGLQLLLDLHDELTGGGRDGGPRPHAFSDLSEYFLLQACPSCACKIPCCHQTRD